MQMQLTPRQFWHAWAVAVIVLAAILLGIAMSGCKPIQMHPEYAQQVELAAIDVAELNRRCQAGDAEACRAGLAEAARTLQLIVDAMHGEPSEGGDPNAG